MTAKTTMTKDRKFHWTRSILLVSVEIDSFNCTQYKHIHFFFYVFLTVRRCTFISVFKQLDAQNLFHNKFLFHASTCFEHMCSKHVEA